MAVTRKEIAEKIKLTPAQNTKIQAIVEQMRAQQAELRTSFRPNFGAPGEGGGRPNVDPEEMRAQFEKMRQATETLQNQAISRISQLLTRPQKDAFNTLLGEDFDLSKLSQQRGPQGGRGGARRGGNGGQPGDRDQENPE